MFSDEIYNEKFHWSEGPVNVLGIWIAKKDLEMEKINLDPLFAKAEAIISSWKPRDLSLLGSVTVSNSLISSLFV